MPDPDDRKCPLCGILTPSEARLDQSTGTLPATAWSCSIFDYHGPHFIRVEPLKDTSGSPATRV